MYMDYAYEENEITQYAAKNTPVSSIKTIVITYNTYINYDLTKIIYSILGYHYF